MRPYVSKVCTPPEFKANLKAFLRKRRHPQAIFLKYTKNGGSLGGGGTIYIYIYELASKLLVCGNGGNHLGCPVSFCMSGRYRFGVSFFRVPRIVLQWF